MFVIATRTLEIKIMFQGESIKKMYSDPGDFNVSFDGMNTEKKIELEMETVD